MTSQSIYICPVLYTRIKSPISSDETFPVHSRANSTIRSTQPLVQNRYFPR